MLRRIFATAIDDITVVLYRRGMVRMASLSVEGRFSRKLQSGLYRNEWEIRNNRDWFTMTELDDEGDRQEWYCDEWRSWPISRKVQEGFTSRRTYLIATSHARHIVPLISGRSRHFTRFTCVWIVYYEIQWISERNFPLCYIFVSELHVLWWRKSI